MHTFPYSLSAMNTSADIPECQVQTAKKSLSTLKRVEKILSADAADTKVRMNSSFLSPEQHSYNPLCPAAVLLPAPAANSSPELWG